MNADEPARTPPNNPALRQRIARAIHRYDNHHGLSGNDMPSEHHRGEADAVLAELLGPIPDGGDTAAWTAVRAIQLMNEAGQQRDAARAELAALRKEQDAYEETVVGDLNETNIGLARKAARAERQREQLAAAVLRIQTLAEQHPVAIPTHLVDEALDQDTAATVKEN